MTSRWHSDGNYGVEIPLTSKVEPVKAKGPAIKMDHHYVVIRMTYIAISVTAYQCYIH